MAQQKLIFAGCIRIWSDNGEFVAEYKKYNEYDQDELICRYYAKSNSSRAISGLAAARAAVWDAAWAAEQQWQVERLGEILEVEA